MGNLKRAQPGAGSSTEYSTRYSEMVVLDQQQHHTWAIPLPPGGCPARPLSHCSLLTARSPLPTHAGIADLPALEPFGMHSLHCAWRHANLRPSAAGSAQNTKVSGQQRMHFATYRNCPIGRRHPVNQRMYVMAANSRHRLTPHDYPTAVLLSLRKYSSSRCTGNCRRWSSNHDAQTVSDTIQGYLDVNLSTLDPQPLLLDTAQPWRTTNQN
jgi:hypothetical protein